MYAGLLVDGQLLLVNVAGGEVEVAGFGQPYEERASYLADPDDADLPQIPPKMP